MPSSGAGTKPAIFWTLKPSVSHFLVDGVLRGQFGLYTDISQRVQAEKALKESEELFRTLSAAAPVVISWTMAMETAATLMSGGWK